MKKFLKDYVIAKHFNKLTETQKKIANELGRHWNKTDVSKILAFKNFKQTLQQIEKLSEKDLDTLTICLIGNTYHEFLYKFKIYNEKRFLNFLRTNPKVIRNIRQTESLNIKILKTFAYGSHFFEYMDVLTEKVENEYLKLANSEISKIKNPTEKQQLLWLKNNMYQFNQIKNPTKKVVKLALKVPSNLWPLIQNNYNLITQDLIEDAVKYWLKNDLQFSISSIPPVFATKLYKLIMKKYPQQIIENTTIEFTIENALELLEIDPQVLKIKKFRNAMQFKNEKFFLKAIKFNPRVILYARCQTKKMCYEAIKYDKKIIKHIRNEKVLEEIRQAFLKTIK